MSKKIAVIGSGITGLSCAWLLSQRYQVSLYEKDDRLGGHSNTVEVDSSIGKLPVDTGFIVYNERNYPNLMALFDHLGVKTQACSMSFSVSNHQMEYAGGEGLSGIFAQSANSLRPEFWRMLVDIIRFYRRMSDEEQSVPNDISLGELLEQQKLSRSFIYNHLLPMGAAIWSTPMDKMLEYSASSFIEFCRNHGLLQLANRPQWHSVVGGSREYVKRIIDEYQGELLCNRAVKSVRRLGGRVLIEDWQGNREDYDELVMACHPDQSLKLLNDASEEESRLLRLFQYQRNRAILHSDESLMPKSKSAWAAWNYLSDGASEVSVSYWMNKLQHLECPEAMIVSLNPLEMPDEDKIHASFLYDHPMFNNDTKQAQTELWNIQGHNNTWFCGAWCGHGFHEDGLQSGLIVAEALGGLSRPWSDDGAKWNARIPLPDSWRKTSASIEAA
ncbi:NAD(P)/FAD-dependent oxidoreductase [Pseudoteredinibacter isoporae]|uniref:Putative NAD/FAD-binding protein n=1 Tax=Pseudoteredinibacter isoporae TaxID=570281 RepID=A0A7X0JPV3_9GAMM|nr:FAD-dependent oxidoreductase [Pseudoteredinibacter isoporae]MBB6520089.1 putative NAD/FAD-binding protein [Pseudoteredinibacter isoporae]NHO85661.1 FAD-dependent oxidoreductase [Pseudoteredinibacter isoporae]NIB25887.1 FAD-dependent oxidoreductase [Pseudoteredinibacter isoporae]